MSASSRIRLLYQDEIWVDGQNRVHRIGEMNTRHAQNAYRYLTDPRCANLYLDSVLSSYLSGPTPSGDAATDAYEGELARLERASENPVAWIKSSPLAEALRGRGWGSPEPEVKEEPEPERQEVLILVRVKIGHDADPIPVGFDIEEALEKLPYDIEIMDLHT